MWGQEHRDQKKRASAEKAAVETEHVVVKQAADETLIDRIANTNRLARLLDIPMEEHLNDLASIIGRGAGR